MPGDHERDLSLERTAGRERETAADGPRRLLIGPDIQLSGDIRACDQILVEGRVDGNIRDCQDIVVSEIGRVIGSATIEQAEIRGRFEGTLTVHGLLLIRASGRVSGTVCYGQIVIERGGELSGEVRSAADGPLLTAADRTEHPVAAVAGPPGGLATLLSRTVPWLGRPAAAQPR